jgi:hypothetical protein
VDEVTHTRTILHTPASLLTPDEIDPSFLDGGTLEDLLILFIIGFSLSLCLYSHAAAERWPADARRHPVDGDGH